MCDTVDICKSLRDGIPPLKQDFLDCLSSIPTETEHASCHRMKMVFPFIPSIDEDVLNNENLIWRRVTTRPAVSDVQFISYSTQSDIAYLVRLYLEDIVFALELDIGFSSEMTMKHNQTDLIVIKHKKSVVGVIKVMKPGDNVLLEPTVLGELLDQLLLKESFSGMRPMIGILTTLEEWVISWFPDDTDYLSQVDQAETSSTTSRKRKTNSISTDVTQNPSKLSRPSDDSMAIDGNTDITKAASRLLCTTDVMNTHDDSILVQRHLCGSFQLMSRVQSVSQTADKKTTQTVIE